MPGDPIPDYEAIRRVREFAKGHGPDLRPFQDHNHFPEHDKLREAIRELLRVYDTTSSVLDRKNGW